MVEEVQAATNEQAPTDVAPAVDQAPTDSSDSVGNVAETPDSGNGDASTPVNTSPAYVPDYKIKVYEQEKELDDPFLKGLMKDAESEKKVKELAQKSMGFDTIKDMHDKFKVKHTEYAAQTQPIVDYYNQASSYLEKGNLEGFFELLKIPDDVIFRYAVKKAEEAQLPQEQQQQIHYQKQLQRERESLANHNQSLQSQQQQQLSQFRNQELGWMMQRPDVSNVSTAFDAKNGAGSFRNLVIQKGLAHYTASGGKEDLTAEQAVMEVVKMIGPFVQPANVNGGPATQSNPQLIQQSGTPPIIPHVSGKSSSPVKKQVRSLADLKKRGEELRSS